ncbi:MAG: alpha/beta hydrolase [Myxococcota bacterium]
MSRRPPSRPFQRGPFLSLPSRPSPPHDYAESTPHELEMRSRPFGDVRVHYRTIGSGPPLLLIHGLMTSSYSWRYVLKPLAAHYTVYAPDLVGSGMSDTPTDRSYRSPAYAEWLVELVDALGIRGAAAIGNSLGGYLAMRAVLRDPTVFSRLVNLHSPGIVEPRLRLLSLLLGIPGLQRGLAAYIRSRPQRFAHQNVHYFDESRKSVEEAQVYGAPLASAAGSLAFARILSEVLHPRDLAEGVQALRSAPFPIPLLLIYATADPMVPPRHGETFHRLIAGSELIWLEDSSHFPQVDCPERLLPPVLEFLSSAAARQPG